MPPKRDIECTCQYCGKLFPKKPSEIRKGEGKFCSRECSNNGKIKERAIRVCAYCGKEYPSNRKTKFCSVECSQKGHIIPNKLITEIPCEYCGKIFLQEKKEQRFCSHACSHAVFTTKVVNQCVICGKDFKVSKRRESTNTTCSRECLSIFKANLMIGNSFALGMKHSEETKAKISEASRRNWNDPEYVKNWGKKVPKNRLEELFDLATPDDVYFVGNGIMFLTFKNGTKKVPDFKIHGQRKVIELFGDYWHAGESTEDLVKQYEDIGFKCIVFWESEIKSNLDEVLDKVNKFIQS